MSDISIPDFLRVALKSFIFRDRELGAFGQSRSFMLILSSMAAFSRFRRRLVAVPLHSCLSLMKALRANATELLDRGMHPPV